MVTYNYTGDLMNNGIQIIYPRTRYLKLNEALKNIIGKIVTEFMDTSKDVTKEKLIYTLNISHDEYSYKDYTSVVFYVSTYTGSDKPNNSIYTITYDKNNDKFVEIKDILRQKASTMDKISEESRKLLSKNNNITNEKIFLDGTSPKPENFKNFAFTERGFLIFFSWDQVTPTPSGVLKIVIPYNKLEVNI